MSERIYSYKDPKSGDVIEAIINDAEPIVRCRNCMYFKYSPAMRDTACYRQEEDGNFAFHMNGDDFCSRGKEGSWLGNILLKNKEE